MITSTAAFAVWILNTSVSHRTPGSTQKYQEGPYKTLVECEAQGAKFWTRFYDMYRNDQDMSLGGAICTARAHGHCWTSVIKCTRPGVCEYLNQNPDEGYICD